VATETITLSVRILAQRTIEGGKAQYDDKTRRLVDFMNQHEIAWQLEEVKAIPRHEW
jgi:hypothetical protein